jgi:hypothetical protein
MAGEGNVLGQLLMVSAPRVVPAGEHEQDVVGTPWDCRAPRPLGDLPGQARYLLDRHGELALRLLDPASGRLLTVVADAASLRLGVGDPPNYLWFEPLLTAGNGNISLRFSTQA